MADTKLANLGMLLRCYEALRNWRALALLIAGFVIAALLVALNGVALVHIAPHSVTLAKMVGTLLMVIAALVLLAGINGSGLMLVDQADGNPPRGIAGAFFGGLGVTLQSIVCLLILGVALVLVVLILWGLSFLSKIPGLGPAFAFLLAGPTMLILAACYAVLAFGVALMFVALWRGHGMLGSLGRAIDIVLKRPLDAVLHFLVLALLIAPIELFVAGVMFGGSTLTTLMYASTRAVAYNNDFGGGFNGYGGGGSPLDSLMGGGASLGAAGVSIGMVIAAVWALFVLIGMLGNILIFDSLAADTSATSAGFLEDKVKQLKQKVEDSRPVAAPAPAPQPPAPAPAAPPAYVAPAPRPPAPQPPTPAPMPPPAAPSAAPAPACASCGTALTPGDRFCGGCGSPVA